MSNPRLREAVQCATAGHTVIGLTSVMVELLNAGQIGDAAEIELQLCALGFRRDGFLGVGRERTPRYVWGARP